MNKLFNSKDSQNKNQALSANYLGCVKNAEHRMRSFVIEFLETYITFEPTEKQIVELEAKLKTYAAKQGVNHVKDKQLPSIK